MPPIPRKALTALLCCAAMAMSAGAPAQPLSGNGEYDRLAYLGEARGNAVARLAAGLERGELTLEYRAERGYLDSLLEALGISPASQTLVFSPTSLQRRHISPATPRALYFSEDSYVGWVQGSELIELMALDSERGLVFYTFANTADAPRVARETRGCLVCHDSAGLLGGGVPQLLARSALYDLAGLRVQDISGLDNVGDTTPLALRWGGWYVSGQHGRQRHLGNLRLQHPQQWEMLHDPGSAPTDALASLDLQPFANLDSLADADLFDAAPYPRATSDIVALLVLEHQISVQNQLVYVRFKADAVLERLGYAEAVQAQRWDALPARGQQGLQRMLDRLVAALLFVDAAPLEDRLRGSAEFTDWFQAQGPRDAQGRSLRDFDLESRLFRYPLSYLIASEAFASLPAYARDYVLQSVTAALRGQHATIPLADWSKEARSAALELLDAIAPPAPHSH